MSLEATHIYILGSGRFGQRAARLLHNRCKSRTLTVVDHLPESLHAISDIACQSRAMDAIDFLTAEADQISSNDWIVPAIPVHVAYAWLRAVIGSESRLKELVVPDSVRLHLPNPIRGNKGQIYTSIATFKCPANCPEPQNKCTVTGKPRPQTLWKTLTGLNIPGYRSICIRSHQLAPGLGGFQFKALQKARHCIQVNSGGFLISTACQCHGVINALYH